MSTPGARSPRPVVSVILCTYNRAGLLREALRALAGQVAGTPPYEIIVVDNNSTDETRAVVRAFTGASTLVRYEFEPEQGLSAARNHGIAAARADLIAFTDDDVRVAPDWVRTIAALFASHEEIDLAGGRVVPDWEAPPPAWLERTGVAPLALVDYGDGPRRIGGTNPLCLVGANLAVRRQVFERVGPFSTAVQRVEHSIGSTEDHELELRAFAAGCTALYDPRLIVTARVPRDRLTKRYHRAWHTGHGRFCALMRDPSLESPGRPAWLGVPAHLYRRIVRELGAYLGNLVRFRPAEAFRRELRLRFLMGFAHQRIFGRST